MIHCYVAYVHIYIAQVHVDVHVLYKVVSRLVLHYPVQTNEIMLCVISKFSHGMATISHVLFLAINLHVHCRHTYTVE